jgi:3-hydroxyisobutyrate dehydrogenase-like beta-hydroxyacid dehydrogenase
MPPSLPINRVQAGRRARRARVEHLVMNSWVLAVTASIAEAVALAEGLGLDRSCFCQRCKEHNSMPYAHLKGEAMIGRD